MEDHARNCRKHSKTAMIGVLNCAVRIHEQHDDFVDEMQETEAKK